MFYILCDFCENQLVLDQNKTLNYFYNNLSYYIKEDGFLNYKDIPVLMMYYCLGCNKEYEFDVFELNTRLKKSIADVALKLKRKNLALEMKDIKPDQDSGLVYCGICPGYDGEGNCLKNIIDRCSIRKV